MSDQTHYYEDGCDPPHPRTVDPLAEALREASEYPWGQTSADWEAYARVAREHIAAEIEAAYNANYGIGREGRDGMVDAARIARGGEQ
jgi:hypothetical protein